ncbi:unnamed protein product [Gongylonema pulchrum]|uniref:Secreted protein n=1 Tax=Gongylonema pulchrum TaxID=637853 RepID=A0A183EUG9_9BILA|nr:unnamed protein product [Gongylonema pulchrum]
MLSCVVISRHAPQLAWCKYVHDVLACRSRRRLLLLCVIGKMIYSPGMGQETSFDIGKCIVTGVLLYEMVAARYAHLLCQRVALPLQCLQLGRLLPLYVSLARLPCPGKRCCPAKGYL